MPVGLDPSLAVSLLTPAADLTLLLDAQGVIQEVALGRQGPELQACLSWQGRPWVDTVTLESRIKVEQLLARPPLPGHPAWRHINHPDASGPGEDLPVLYTSLKLPGQDQVIAIGREMRSTAELQQRLVEAQMSMDRHYASLRHLETRYRLLFQSVGEAVLIVDASLLRVTDLNAAAVSLLGEAGRRMVGRPLVDAFEPSAQTRLPGLLDKLRRQGRPQSIVLRRAAGGLELRLTATLFRQESGDALLIQLSPLKAKAHRNGAAAPDPTEASLRRVVENAPDGLVITDLDGVVLLANSAFLEMAQPGSSEPVIGQPISRWLGRSSVDFRVMSANLKQTGTLHLYATTLRSTLGTQVDVEVSAVSVDDGEMPCMGFTVRDIGRRPPSNARADRELPRTVGELTGLVGRLPLKDIVAETTDLIEQLCIEAALQLTRDNRASAAEMLSLSRQSLYVKLRRYGMLEPGVGPEPVADPMPPAKGGGKPRG